MRELNNCRVCGNKVKDYDMNVRYYCGTSCAQLHRHHGDKAIDVWKERNKPVEVVEPKICLISKYKKLMQRAEIAGKSEQIRLWGEASRVLNDIRKEKQAN